jgi:outer membrane protein TolC
VERRRGDAEKAKGAPIVTSLLLLSKRSRISGVAAALVLAVLGGGTARAQRVLTIDEALAIARRNNRDLTAAKERVAQAQTGVDQALALLLPTVAAQGKYTHNYKEVKLDFSALGTAVKLAADTGAATIGLTTGQQQANIIQDLAALQKASQNSALTSNSGPSVIQAQEQVDFSLNASVPLVVPAAYPGLNAAKATVAAGRANQAATEATVLLTTAQAYYAAAGTEEVVEARQHSVVVAQKALDNARARLEAGVVNRVEVKRAELQLVRQKQSLLEADDQRAAAYRSLGTIMNMHDPVKAQASKAPPPEPADVLTLTKLGLKLRPEIDALDKTIDSNRLTRSSNIWRWAPVLSAFGTVRAFNYKGFSGDNYLWAVGLQLDWTLYDGGIRDAQAKLAAAQLRENEARLDQLRDQIRDEIDNDERALKTKRSAVEAAIRSVQLSKETLDLVQVQHDAGTATQLDLLQAQDNLVAAEVALAQSHFDLALGALQLQRASGEFPGNLSRAQ